MSGNGNGRSARPRIEMRQAAPSPVEAAAIAAAIEQFLRDTAAPPPQSAGRAAGGWLRTSLCEGAGIDPANAWSDGELWGR